MCAVSSDVTNIHLQPFGGGDDGRLPVGIWTIRATATGTATGGNVQINVKITNDDFVYSFEDVAYDGSTAMTHYCQLAIPFWGDNTIQYLAWHTFTYATKPYRGATDAAKPYGMGIPFKVDVTKAIAYAQCTIAWETNVNSELYTGFAWGYYWQRDVFKLGVPIKPTW